MSRFATNDPVAFRKDNLRSKKTEQQTTFAVKILQEFMNERGTHNSEDLLQISKPQLTDVLQDFYSNIRNKNGQLYKKNTLLAIRQSINRYFKENGRTFDIITDTDFTQANNNFTSLLRKTREEGKGTVTHHEAIILSDLQKLYNHPLAFNTDTPQGLINKTIFEIILYFCRRGQENLSELKVNEFEIKTDVEGHKFVCKTTTELTKNHQGTSNETEGSGAKMFATGTTQCPVSSFQKYLDKRNELTDRLFLHPKNSFCDTDAIWYRNEPMGPNTLKIFMKNLSKSAALSREYTNHCIRSTCITLLDYCGFQSRHIKTISGHRNEASLASYCYDTSDKQKKSMSDAISLCTHGGGALVPIENVRQDKATESRNVSSFSLSQETTFQQTIFEHGRNSNQDSAMQHSQLTVKGQHTETIQSGPLVQNVPYDKDIDFLEMPDDMIVQIAETAEKSVTRQKIIKPAPAPSFNISNCTVNINYYGSKE